MRRRKRIAVRPAERVQPESTNAAAHDAVTRLLHRMEPSTEQLWQEAQAQVRLSQGVLVVDDSTLDKWYAEKMELVTRHWSGKQGRVVQGINLITLLWTEGDRHIPLDYRFYQKRVDGATKNDHFRSMLETAKERGFAPRCVVFDSWYSSLDNLKLVRGYEWIWLTRLKRIRLRRSEALRQVNPDTQGNRPLQEVAIAASGTVVHLKGYGFVKVFKIVAPNGDIDYWATNDLQMGERRRKGNLPSLAGPLRSTIGDSNNAVEPNLLRFDQVAQGRNHVGECDSCLPALRTPHVDDRLKQH